MFEFLLKAHRPKICDLERVDYFIPGFVRESLLFSHRWDCVVSSAHLDSYCTAFEEAKASRGAATASSFPFGSSQVLIARAQKIAARWSSHISPQQRETLIERLAGSIDSARDCVSRHQISHRNQPINVVTRN